jgi:hypothetical protein
MPDATAAAYLPAIKRRPKEIMEAVASAEESLSQARPSDSPNPHHEASRAGHIIQPASGFLVSPEWLSTRASPFAPFARGEMTSATPPTLGFY